MNLGVASIQNKRVVFFFMFLILIGGMWCVSEHRSA